MSRGSTARSRIGRPAQTSGVLREGLRLFPTRPHGGQFLRRVKEALRIPILGLFDSDAHGLKILSVYMQARVGAREGGEGVVKRKRPEWERGRDERGQKEKAQ